MEKRKTIGKAFIKLNAKDKGKWVDIHVINKSHINENIVLVRWYDHKDRRVTSFVKPEDIREV